MHKVAIAGRPNVGKSSRSDRLLKKRSAVVADVPGVTRDLKEGVVETDRGRFLLVDTGGLWSGDKWEKKIQEKVDRALEDAEVVLFAVDGRAELTQADYEVAEYLRRKGKPVILVATKVDDPKHELYLGPLYGLGFGDPIPTSSEHARGLEELLEAIWERLPVRQIETEPEVAGTRDAIDVEFFFGGQRFVLVDTAGIRKRPESLVEELAIRRSLRAMDEADVVLLVVDPFQVGDRELKLANEALDRGKPVLLVITKWDLVDKEDAPKMRRLLREKLAHLDHLPRVFTSALTRQNLDRIFREAVRLHELNQTRVPTAELNRWVAVWTSRVQMPNFKGKPLKILYATQPEVAPPTFVFFVNHPEFVTRAFENYLKNRIGEDLGLREVPFRLVFRGRREE